MLNEMADNNMMDYFLYFVVCELCFCLPVFGIEKYRVATIKLIKLKRNTTLKEYD